MDLIKMVTVLMNWFCCMRGVWTEDDTIKVGDSTYLLGQ